MEEGTGWGGGGRPLSASLQISDGGHGVAAQPHPDDFWHCMSNQNHTHTHNFMNTQSHILRDWWSTDTIKSSILNILPEFIHIKTATSKQNTQTHYSLFLHMFLENMDW